MPAPALGKAGNRRPFACIENALIRRREPGMIK
jgi:hypothetical protein